MATNFLSDAEFKPLVIRMLSEVSENFNKEIEKHKKEPVKNEKYNN